MAIQGLCAPALFHKEQRDHLQEGWFPQGKPNCGPSSISWATGSGATYLTSLAFSHLENNNNSNNMSWAVIRILSFCFPDMPSFFSPLHVPFPWQRALPPDSCGEFLFLIPASEQISSPQRGLFWPPYQEWPSPDTFITLLHFIVYITLITTWNDLSLFVYLVIVCFPWLGCKFHKYMFPAVYTMLGTFSEWIMC